MTTARIFAMPEQKTPALRIDPAKIFSDLKPQFLEICDDKLSRDESSEKINIFERNTIASLHTLSTPDEMIQLAEYLIEESLKQKEDYFYCKIMIVHIMAKLDFRNKCFEEVTSRFFSRILSIEKYQCTINPYVETLFICLFPNREEKLTTPQQLQDRLHRKKQLDKLLCCFLPPSPWDRKHLIFSRYIPVNQYDQHASEIAGIRLLEEAINKNCIKFMRKLIDYFVAASFSDPIDIKEIAFDTYDPFNDSDDGPPSVEMISLVCEALNKNVILLPTLSTTNFQEKARQLMQEKKETAPQGPTLSAENTEPSASSATGSAEPERGRLTL